MWHILSDEENGIVVLNDAHFFNPSILDSNYAQRASNYANIANTWNHRFLYQYLSQELNEKFLNFDFKKQKDGAPTLNQLDGIKQINKNKKTQKLTLFASGLGPNEIIPIEKILQSNPLEHLSIFDASPDTLEKIIAALPISLISLNLTNSSLYQSSLSKKIKNLKKLKKLHLNSTQLSKEALEKIIEDLPGDMEVLSLGFMHSSWDLKAAQIFGSRKLPKLKYLDLESNWLPSTYFELIFPALNERLEVLRLGGNLLNLNTLRKLSAKNFPQIKEIGLEGIRLYSNINPLQAPKGASSYKFYSTTFDASTLLTTNKIKYLDFSDPNYEKNGIHSIFAKLDSNISYLGLAGLALDIADIQEFAKQKSILHIERLNLSANQLDDHAIEILTHANFSVDYLDLSNNFIRNRGAQMIAKKWGKRLKGINLGQNPITEIGVNALMESFGPQLQRLELGSVLSLDIPKISKQLPESLKVLDLSDNQLSDSDMQSLALNLPTYLYSLNLAKSNFESEGILAMQQPADEHALLGGRKGISLH